MRPKQVHKNSIIGQNGINLIATTLGEMGYLWTQTTGVSDAGIDGFIEIRNPVSGEATNLILQVQSKATGREWESESADSFVFRCEDRDLAYWLQGNAPVILIASRPSDKECYWVSVKDYFSDLSRRKSKKIFFDKKRDSFTAASANSLFELAKPRESGLYLAPPPVSEHLYANLLPVSRYAQHIYSAETEHRDKDTVRDKLKTLGVRGGFEWFLQDGRLISFYDLRKEPWSELCVPGTAEEFSSDDWALSHDQVKRNEFVRLLGSALRGFLSAKGIWFYKPKNGTGYYFFAPSRPPEIKNDEIIKIETPPIEERVELPLKTVKWSSQKDSERTVFKAYYGKKDPSRIVYYRHAAFEPKFHRFGWTWYLEVTPTYHFTSDGHKLSGYHDSYLSGIKRLEKHAAVHGNVRFWTYVLTYADMFTKNMEFIRLSEGLSFQTDFGIPESDWIERADDDEKRRLADVDPTQVLLFE